MSDYSKIDLYLHIMDDFELVLNRYNLNDTTREKVLDQCVGILYNHLNINEELKNASRN